MHYGCVRCRRKSGAIPFLTYAVIDHSGATNRFAADGRHRKIKLKTKFRIAFIFFDCLDVISAKEV